MSPLSTEFSQVVAMDLKQFRPGIYFLQFYRFVHKIQFSESYKE